MTYKASLDTTSKIVTVLVSSLFLFIILLQVILYFRYHSWHMMAIAVLLCIVYAFTYLYRPLHYKIESNTIIVHRLASDIVLLRSEIKNIELIGDKKLSGTIRTFGVGGVFGYFGQFMNSEIGSMTWYATKHYSKAVMIEMKNNKKIIVTPDNPEDFVNQLQPFS